MTGESCTGWMKKKGRRTDLNMIKLSEAELKLMNVLWDTPYITIRNLTELFAKDTEWEKHTIITMLRRLEKKGAVSYRQTGRAKEFYAIINREKTTEEEAESFLERVYQGSLSLMLNQLVSRNKLSEEERKELRRMLER